MESDKILLTPCPPRDYKNPYVKARGNIYTRKLEYRMSKEYSEELFSNPAFRTSQAAVGELMFQRFEELVTQCYCPFMLEVGRTALKAPIIAFQMLDDIPYEGAWKVHYHLVLEVKRLIQTFIYYYMYEYRDPKNPSAPPFRPRKPGEFSHLENGEKSAYSDEPNENNPYSLSDRKMANAKHLYIKELREKLSDLKGITKARTVYQETKRFLGAESEELKTWLQSKGFL